MEYLDFYFIQMNEKEVQKFVEYEESSFPLGIMEVYLKIDKKIKRHKDIHPECSKKKYDIKKIIGQ